jgi:hypothetical protein
LGDSFAIAGEVRWRARLGDTIVGRPGERSEESAEKKQSEWVT